MAELESVADELRRVSPADLHVAFAYELALLVRGGPRGAGAAPLPSPAALLGLAQRAATAGALSWLTPLTLREQLARLEADLHEAGAWDPAKPLWWRPLPSLTAAEELWASLDEGAGKAAACSQACGRSDLPGWIVYPRLVAPEALCEIAQEIETAYAAGRLGLERGGIGRADRRAPHRSDEVAFLTGLEPELPAAAPRLAVLVQWLLDRFASSVVASFPDRQLQPPVKAMLARYPAPSAGYRPHLDNPGGGEDNGRAFTCVVYLNPPSRECAGGELALWAPGAVVSNPPGALLAPCGGSAVLFDARAVPHQVRPLHPGPPRWALTLWFQDDPCPAGMAPGVPRSSIPSLTATDALQAIPDPQLAPGALLFYELADQRAGGRIVALRKSAARPRIGLVATVYRGDEMLDRWCEHHFRLGLDHLVLVFDHLEEPAEAAGAARLRARYPERLTVWSGAEVKAARWPALPAFPQREQLLEWAEAGASSFAVASRQALNASAALVAARAGELGGAPLDWLLHLDADEWFHLEGDGRGGSTLHDHFAAASAAGRVLLRYVDHELLLPWQPGAPPRFKVNPRLAAARLGLGGWQALVAALRMDQKDARPYFTGYHNGKSAVAVAHGLAAAGVHGWHLAEAPGGGAAPGQSATLAGPSILHLHRPSPEEFRAKYLGIAGASWAGPRPFAPCPAEDAALALLRSLEGADPAVVERELDALYHRLTSFTGAELDLLAEAGLILDPAVETL